MPLAWHQKRGTSNAPHASPRDGFPLSPSGSNSCISQHLTTVVALATLIPVGHDHGYAHDSGADQSVHWRHLCDDRLQHCRAAARPRMDRPRLKEHRHKLARACELSLRYQLQSFGECRAITACASGNAGSTSDYAKEPRETHEFLRSSNWWALKPA